MNRFLATVLLLCATSAFAATPEQAAALREIEAFTNAQQAADPYFPAVETELLKRVDEMVKSLPPAQWAPTVKRQYFALSERARTAELARVTASESAALERLPGYADQRWLARMASLEKDLISGALSPREHALHARAAAQQLLPGDQILLNLRETRVSLATSYEMGQIGRAEFDDRWARARAAAQQGIASRDRMEALQAAEADQLEAGQRARMWQGVSDRFRQQRPVRCDSVTGPLGTSTTCR